MEKVVKKVAKKTVDTVLTIDTNLINKEEVFKMLALAQATERAVLLIGDPGTAKTKAVIDYAKAWIGHNTEEGHTVAGDFMDRVYILETDEGTKSSEVKGMPDLNKLLTENKYELCAPITEAEIVIVNEIDKASSNIRNSLLGVMNERFLFSGKDKIPCKWKLFVATCNEIPKDEINSPFWDRFILKHNVSRISTGDMVKYYGKGGKDYKESLEVLIPNKNDLDSVDLPISKLEKFLDVSYHKCSDRTLTFVPALARAVSYIWDVSIDKSLVKVADIMIGKTASSELQNKLMSPEIKIVMGKVDMLQSYNDVKSIDTALSEIKDLLTEYAKTNKIDETQVQEMETAIHYVLENHPVKKKEKEIEEVLGDLEEVIDGDPHGNQTVFTGTTLPGGAVLMYPATQDQAVYTNSVI